MPSQKRQFGDEGEREAESFLLKNGYKILDRNFRVKNIGEIDIVTERRNKLFFIEVKTRNVPRETSFPIEFSINEKKRRNLKKICQIYLNERHIFSKEWQVDAIFVKIGPGVKRETQHMENILWEEYY